MLYKSYILLSSSQLLCNPLNSPLYSYNALSNESHATQHTYPSTNVCSDYMFVSQCWLVDRPSDNEALFVSSVDSRTRTHSQLLRQNMFQYKGSAFHTVLVQIKPITHTFCYNYTSLHIVCDYYSISH